MTTETHGTNVNGRQILTSGYPLKVSRKFPVSSNPAFSVELMRIELMASRVRFWRCGKEVKHLASLEVSHHEISPANYSINTRKLGGAAL